MIVNRIKNFFKMIGLLIFFIFCFFFVGTQKENENIIWGINFSQQYAKDLALDYKEVYLALLDDLKARHLRVAFHWQFLEKEEGVYDFSDFDWQVEEAQKRGAKMIPIIGLKTSRWPECHMPEWAKSLNKEQQQERILKMIEAIVLKYKNSPAIEFWQVENEPFFGFGECPWKDDDFVKKEIDLVRSLDKSHKIIVTDSGEGSMWFKTAKIADYVGVTTYRNAWFSEYKKYVEYPLPSVFYNRKLWLIKTLFGKDVFSLEFQAEPWGPKPAYALDFDEQKKSMDLNRFLDNIKYARNTDFSRIYLWGGEWMYWAKVRGYEKDIWEEAKKIYK